LSKTHKNKKQNKFIISERQYIGITDTINGFRSTLASCEQEQPADTVRQAVAREEPGVREQRREQEQLADTLRQAVA